MTKIARAILKTAAFALVGICNPLAHVAAQTFPSKPVRIIVPYAPGGSTDVVSRLLSQHLTERWKVQLVVENRPGGNSIIGIQELSDVRSLRALRRWRSSIVTSAKNETRFITTAS